MKKVIIVEDDLSILDTMTVILRSAGHLVITYLDGALIMKNDYIRPHIFIIDKQLKGVDGLDICRHIKTAEETKHIPVIIVSATPDIRVLAKAAGADDALEKPFKMQELRDIVARHLAT